MCLAVPHFSLSVPRDVSKVRAVSHDTPGLSRHAWTPGPAGAAPHSAARQTPGFLFTVPQLISALRPAGHRPPRERFDPCTQR